MKIHRGQVSVILLSIILSTAVLFFVCTIGEKQDINQLTDNQLRSELVSIKGMGPVLTERVIEYRQKHKPIVLKELDLIRGIGDKRLALIKKKFRE